MWPFFHTKWSLYAPPAPIRKIKMILFERAQCRHLFLRWRLDPWKHERFPFHSLMKEMTSQWMDVIGWSGVCSVFAAAQQHLGVFCIGVWSHDPMITWSCSVTQHSVVFGNMEQPSGFWTKPLNVTCSWPGDVFSICYHGDLTGRNTDSCDFNLNTANTLIWPQNQSFSWEQDDRNTAQC